MGLNDFIGQSGLGLLALGCSLALQGCEVNIPRHAVGNWEAKVNYLNEYEYVAPGKTSSEAILNSCITQLSTYSGLQCSGHGRCKDWNELTVGIDMTLPRLSFCECDRDWADPECRTPRKSQATAFVLSLFLGVFGADQFYLGFFWFGLLKLLTGGGIGFWYLYDLCRIGSTPVETRYYFRVAADLPHFAFVLSVVTAMLFFGFLISICSIQRQRVKKAHEVMLLRAQAQEEPEEVVYEEELPLPVPIKDTTPMRPATFTGYGAALAPRTVTLPPRSMPLPSAPVLTQSITPPPMTRVVTPPMSPRSSSAVVTPPVPMTLPMPVSSSILPVVAGTPTNAVNSYPAPPVTTTPATTTIAARPTSPPPATTTMVSVPTTAPLTTAAGSRTPSIALNYTYSG